MPARSVTAGSTAEVPATATRWAPNPQVVAQRLDGTMVLVNLQTDRILELNETAAALFEALGDGSAQAEIEARLAERYEVDEARLRAEVERMLRLLAEQRMVVAHAG